MRRSGCSGSPTAGELSYCRTVLCKRCVCLAILRIDSFARTSTCLILVNTFTVISLCFFAQPSLLHH